MWTRAAVALRNINICEMPSHDEYLGTGRRAGCGALACLMTASPWQCLKHGLGCGLWDKGCMRPMRPRSGVSGVPGLDAPGRAPWASTARFCVPPLTCRTACMLPRVLPVTLNWDVFYTFDPHPAPLSIACGPSLCVPPVPVGFGERRGVGSRFAFPRESQTECLWPVCPATLSFR